MKLPTDCVKFTEPTLARVSPVVAKMAHTDGTRVMQYQSDAQKSMKTTNMQIPMDYLEIPEPTLPRVLLELAEEDRNAKVESGRYCYMEEVQSQVTGLTRPVFITAMEYSSPVLKKGAMRAAGVSTEMMPTRNSAGRRRPVDQSGPQNKTDQPVLPVSDADQVGTVPAGPVGPDIIIDRIQPVADGPVGQYSTRRPVGTDEMFSTSDSDQPTADGPVGRFITHSPMGPDIMPSACDPDRPVADGPVGQSFILGPVGPRRMFSLYELNQPVAVGPVGQPYTTGPVGTQERESDCKRMDRIADSPMGSTEILDQVKQTESPIQTDFMKLGTINEPASLGDTPPSSDSGVHSLGEQWENMSTSSIDMESEQNERPTHGSVMGRCVSDSRVPPNTEEDEDINYPWTDCLLNEESDENLSIDIQQNGRKIQYNDVTICENKNSSVNFIELHRPSQPKGLFSEAVDDGPCLTVQNPADVVGETMFDCRPSVLPVSIPLRGLSPGTVAEARESRSFRPAEETGKSIMDMDTNEITINRIVGFEWDEAGTDLEVEMPTPVLSPVQIVAPVIPPAGTADPFGRGNGFDLDLAKVMCDISMIPSMITPLEESEVPPPSRAAEYAAPATPAFETVLESPGYTVPEESVFTWIPGFVTVSETVLEEEGGYLLSLVDPPPLPVISVITEPVIPMMPPTPDDKRNESGTGSVRQTDRAKVFVVESTEGSTSSPICQDAQDIGPDLTREGPFDACEAEVTAGAEQYAGMPVPHDIVRRP